MKLPSFDRWLAAQPPLAEGSVWWVGYSGGLDSTVLLHALVQRVPRHHIKAVHVNHQISANADAWQLHCQTQCAFWGVELRAEKVRVVNAGKGIEDAARQIRYQVFEHCVSPEDRLLTAHHANDQAETLLLRLLRGTGPRGLIGIRRSREFTTTSQVYRPLLDVTRAQLEAYATHYGLSWIEDESNEDDSYDRNFLRQHVVPLLEKRWPTFTSRWQQTADICEEQAQLVDDLAALDLAALNERTERVGYSIDLTLWLAMSSHRQRNVLRYWLRKHMQDVPEARHLMELQQQIAREREDAEINVTFGASSLRVFQKRLYLLPAVLPDSDIRMMLTATSDSVLSPPRLKARLPGMQIRYRVGGERCKPSGRAHSQTLKRLLQEHGLEPWLRDLVPLVYVDDIIVAVGDLWICEGYVAAKDEPGLVLRWELATGIARA